MFVNLYQLLLYPFLLPIMIVSLLPTLPSSNHSSSPLDDIFTRAASEFQVPRSLLMAICDMEGHLSMNEGAPSFDGGYGCMHIIENQRADDLDISAAALGVDAKQIQQDLATNLRAGAFLLRQDALQLSSTHTLPDTLAGWYHAVAKYCHPGNRTVAHLYADAVYQILRKGFQGTDDNQDRIILSPQAIQAPLDLNLAGLSLQEDALPQGCSNDGKADYPDAIDCIVNPRIHDCIPLPDHSPLPCSYNSANRPSGQPIREIVIHDIEGTAINAINTFLARKALVSTHYVVDSNGTVYQIVREKDIAFQAGNMWYNNHSIGIEHTGYDATGFLWYNATQYLASARLAAYLVNKYHLPIDHNHLVSHGTIPAPTLATTPNHVDPGPYWLWDYYLGLIAQQGIASNVPRSVHRQLHTVTIHPRSGRAPFGRSGTETPANFNFFYLYSGPSTASPLIPGNSRDVTDERANVESTISYNYLSKTLDPAGSGKMLYRIWFGVENPAVRPMHFLHAQQAWLAVAPQDVVEDMGTGKVAMLISENGKPVPVSGRATSGSSYVIGDAPDGATFVSAFGVVEDASNDRIWYEINYNHRQAWVNADNVEIDN